MCRLVHFNYISITFHKLQDCLEPLSMQALPAPGESLCIIEMGGSGATEHGEQATTGGLFLSIGLAVST